VLAVGVLATSACLAAGGFVVSVYMKLGELVRFSEDEVAVSEAAAGEPENYLIVGSDSRANVDPNDPDFADVLPNADVGGTRADTIIVARVDPESTEVDMVSFPRDLWVPVPGAGESKINAAYGKGRQVLIDTIAQNFGVEIHHYVEIDFTGFQRLVDAIDGVPIWLDTEYRDTRSGLAPVGPGCVTLEGDEALSFARSRHLQYRDADGDWEQDPTGDLGRISRQQLFIRKALEQVLELDLTDVLTFNRLLDVAVDSVKVDSGLSNDDLRSLAERFRSFDPDTIRNHALPTDPFRTSGGAAALRLVENEAQPILNIFRGLPPGAVTPAQVKVAVQNGTGIDGQAGQTAEALAAVGFDTAVIQEGHEPLSGTTVQYAPGSEEAARLVARHLTSKAQYMVDETLEQNEVRLVTGADFTTVVREPWPEEAVPAPSTPQPPGETATSEPTTTTSTTVIGVIPDEPPPGEEC
jgi:LCP family protein required for cell wall assembly